MTRSLLIAALALIIGASFGLPSGHAQTPPPKSDKVSQALEVKLAAAKPNDRFDVLVTFSGSSARTRAKAAAQTQRAQREFKLISGFQATLTTAQIRALSGEAGLHRIEENAKIELTLDSAQASFGTAAARQTFAVDGSGVGICIVDTGVDAGHEQFDDAGKIASWIDLVNNAPAPYDDQGHGSHVASIAAGSGTGGANAAKYKGVAPGASIYAAKVFNAAGQTSESTVIAAIEWCVDQPGVQIISMSLATTDGSDGLDALSLASNAAVDAGKIVVAGAGNSGDAPGTVGSPAAASKVVAVGAVADYSGADTQGIYLATFSSRGPTLGSSPRIKPDIVTPGVNITAAAVGTASGYTAKSGTSMATPFASGAIALALDAAGGTLTDGQVKALLQSTALDRGAAGKDNEYGWGLLDGYAFVGEAAGASYTPHAFPKSIDIETTVPDNGTWEMSFTVAQADLAKPIAATVITESGSAVCTIFLFGTCYAYGWNPDLSVELLAPNGSVLGASDCPSTFDCGPYARQETVHVMPTVAGTYRLVVHADPDGGDFSVSLSNGTLVGTDVFVPPPLAGHWALNELAGVTAADSSGLGYHGTLVNGPAWRAGRVDGALRFDGADDRVDLPSQSIDRLGNLSLAFWLQTTSTSPLRSIVSAANATNDNEFSVFVINGTTVRLHTGETAGSYVEWSVPSLPNGAWHHIAIVRDASADKATLYFDGAAVATRNTTLSALEVDANGFVLGQEQDTVGANFDPNQAFAGSLDDVYVFGRLLTAAEIGNLAAVPLDASPPTAPSGLSASASAGQASLSWTGAADPQTGIASYRIYRDTQPGTVKALLAEIPATSTAYLDAVNPGVDYFYDVAAVNGHGIEGPRSNEAAITSASTLLGQWPLDDGAGTVASDSSTYNNDGTLVNGPVWSTGRVGGALSFDANNDRVDLPAQAINGLSDLSLALWLKTTQTSPLRSIVSAANATNDNEFSVFVINGTTLRLHTGETAGSYVEWAVPSLSNGVWHHIAIVRSASADQATLYVDGVSQGVRNTPLSILLVSAGGFVLGQDQDTVGANFDPNQAFGGSLDEVYLYGRLLTPAEIGEIAGVPDESPPSAPSNLVATVSISNVSLTWAAAADPETGITSYRIYRDTQPGTAKTLLAEVPGNTTAYVDNTSPETDFFYDVAAVNGDGTEGPRSNEAKAEPLVAPIAHWKFDDGSGTLAADSSGNGFNAALVNGPTWTTGRFGGALNFDGNNDRVNLPYQALDGRSNATVSLWVRTTKGTTQSFFSGANSGNDNEFLLYQQSRTQVNFSTGESANSYVWWSVTNLANNAWRHVVIVRDASADKVTLYVDGVSVSTQDTPVSSLTIASGGLVLGQEQDSVGGGFSASQAFRGQMDDVRIYDRVLSQQQIAALFAGN
ncbi:MAG TPA: LamG-like jellyroll fold domain-containing protein [Dehalococcoidia bacterium]|nr:LamG-like jellyroll fold domain-containing protein [Dehalococcoidia bacterium]